MCVNLRNQEGLIGVRFTLHHRPRSYATRFLVTHATRIPVTANRLWEQSRGRQSGDCSGLQRRTRDRKVSGSSPGRIGRRIFFSIVNFLCWLLYRYPSPPPPPPTRITAVARKRSRSFRQKCRWQVTVKHSCVLRMWLWIKWYCELVHGYVVYTELAQRRQ